MKLTAHRLEAGVVNGQNIFCPETLNLAFKTCRRFLCDKCQSSPVFHTLSGRGALQESFFSSITVNLRPKHF